MEAARLDRLAAHVQASPKARSIDPGFVRFLCRAEAGDTRASDKEVVKRVKRSIHRVGGAYLPDRVPYDSWLHELERADGPGRRLALVDGFLAGHTSMRERLGVLDEYYAALFDGLEDARSVLDLACGLNPLALHHMPIRPERYLACDIYLDLLEFVASAGALVGHPVEAWPCNLMETTPGRDVDVALLLKTLPCLDQRGYAVGRTVLAGLGARHAVVTYPVASIGGRSKGMATTYRSQFWEMIEPLDWDATELDLPLEIGFRLTRPGRV